MSSNRSANLLRSLDRDLDFGRDLDRDRLSTLRLRLRLSISRLRFAGVDFTGLGDFRERDLEFSGRESRFGGVRLFLGLLLLLLKSRESFPS